MSKGILIVMSGPSGVGKGTILEQLRAHYEPDRKVYLSVSATTRGMRPGEIDGYHYYFIDRDRFVSMRDSGELLEHAEYAGNMYGTPAAPIDSHIAEGDIVVLDIETRGAFQVMEKRADAISVFIMPPDMDELERRLRGRGTETEEQIQRRMSISRGECERAGEYGHIIYNDKLENAVEAFCKIIDTNLNGDVK